MGMPRGSTRAKPGQVRVRNAAPFSQAIYLEETASQVVEPGETISVPRDRVEDLKRQGWEILGREEPEEPAKEE